MTWYPTEPLVRALHQARVAEARPRSSRVNRAARATRPVTVALQPAPVR